MPIPENSSDSCYLTQYREATGENLLHSRERVSGFSQREVCCFLCLEKGCRKIRVNQQMKNGRKPSDEKGGVVAPAIEALPHHKEEKECLRLREISVSEKFLSPRS